MQLGKILSIASLAYGVLFYVAAVSGLLWPRTPPTDIGLLCVSVTFTLFGALGLLLKPEAKKA